MVNSAKGYPHLTVGHHCGSIPRRGSGEVDDRDSPANVEPCKQVVNTPLMLAVDGAP